MSQPLSKEERNFVVVVFDELEFSDDPGLHLPVDLCHSGPSRLTSPTNSTAYCEG